MRIDSEEFLMKLEFLESEIVSISRKHEFTDHVYSGISYICDRNTFNNQIQSGFLVMITIPGFPRPIKGRDETINDACIDALREFDAVISGERAVLPPVIMPDPRTFARETRRLINRGVESDRENDFYLARRRQIVDRKLTKIPTSAELDASGPSAAPVPDAAGGTNVNESPTIVGGEAQN